MTCPLPSSTTFSLEKPKPEGVSVPRGPTGDGPPRKPFVVRTPPLSGLSRVQVEQNGQARASPHTSTPHGSRLCPQLVSSPAQSPSGPEARGRRPPADARVRTRTNPLDPDGTPRGRCTACPRAVPSAAGRSPERYGSWGTATASVVPVRLATDSALEVVQEFLYSTAKVLVESSS